MHDRPTSLPAPKTDSFIDSLYSRIIFFHAAYEEYSGTLFKDAVQFSTVATNDG